MVKIVVKVIYEGKLTLKLYNNRPKIMRLGNQKGERNY